jgi:hypothetical protein
MAKIPIQYIFNLCFQPNIYLKKLNLGTRGRGQGQVVQCLPTIGKTLSSNLIIAKKRKKKKVNLKQTKSK